MPLQALVTAAGGLGDILRATPLVRVLGALGYEVDLLVAPDYAGTVALLEGAPGVRRLFHVPSRWSRDTARRTEGLAGTRYDVATFTYWSHQQLPPLVKAARSLAFDRRWVNDGDPVCVDRIARELGWIGEIPPPIAVHSGRRFDLEPGTVALHPGCKAGWGWKKWHGFADLAALLPSVVVIGGDEDRRVDGTYFARPFAWPAHARDYTGALSLPDSAALLGQCAALVSNDSGLMHLGVALGIPVVGVFGITSPAREALPVASMLPVTKGLSCEPECRRQPWGRRGCHRRLECLRTLTAEEVLARLRAHVPSLFGGVSLEMESTAAVSA
jgi:ADP-heptose:LPS heptosyltransferase